MTARRDAIALAAAVLAALGWLLWGAWETPSVEAAQGTCADDIGRAEADVLDAFVVTPHQSPTGDLIEVRRTDGDTMEHGIFSLYGDPEAGCRSYALSSAYEGPLWEDVTDQTRGFAVEIDPSEEDSMVFPEPPTPGRYLFCWTAVDTDSTTHTECGEFTV